MKKYDATQSLRQRVRRPNILPFFNALLIVVFLLIVNVSPLMATKCTHVSIPQAINFDIEPLFGLPVIYIFKDGTVVLNDRMVEDLEKLTVLIEDEMEKHQPEENKILLKIDEDVPFGRVQEVLRYVRKAQVETVGLITLENAALGHFLATPTK
jgi:biopolymer transport protein ExbD